MIKFELSRLLRYDDDAIVAEMRRVAAIVEQSVLTIALFDQYSKVESTTVRRRFGSWRNALDRAGIGDRYSGAVVTRRTSLRCGLRHSDSEMLAELRRVAAHLSATSLSVKRYDVCSQIHSSSIVRRFGSWPAAMAKAGLTPGARRYAKEDYFENLLKVWTHHARQPKWSEMDMPPSEISSGAYERRFGRWTSALQEFVEAVCPFGKPA